MNADDRASFPEHLDDAFFAGIIDTSPDPYVVVDLTGTIRWTNRAADDLLGSGVGAAIGRNMLDFVTPASTEAALQAFAQYTHPDRPDTGWVGPPIPLELQLGRGRSMPAEVRLTPTRDLSFPGAVIALHVNAPETALYDTIERVIADAPLHEAMTSILRLIALGSPYSVPVIGWEWNGERFTEWVASPDAPTIDGDPLPTDLDRPAPWDIRIDRAATATNADVDSLDPELGAAVRDCGFAACWVFPLRRSDATEHVDATVVIWRHATGYPLLNIARRIERIAGLVQLAVDLHRSRQVLRTAARTDAVTGLLNRTALAEHLTELDRRPTGLVHGVIYCDLDHFKGVNDLYGHPTGDRALKVAAERIRSRLRAGDHVARVGGDEFIVVSTADVADEIGVLADRLVEAFRDPILVSGMELAVGLSAGWTAVDAGTLGTEVTGEQLIERADAALLIAKAAGKNRVARV